MGTMCTYIAICLTMKRVANLKTIKNKLNF